MAHDVPMISFSGGCCGKPRKGPSFHNDDTHMQVLELTTKKKRGEPIREDAPGRNGMFTTGILSLSAIRPHIALFFTGPNHSGENLRKVLEQRIADLSPPGQMGDGLSHNEPKDLLLRRGGSDRLFDGVAKERALGAVWNGTTESSTWERAVQ